MEREKSALYLGLGLLIAGIVVLMFVLVTVIGLAANPGPWMQRQLPSSAQGPTALFAWHSEGLNVTFSDQSTEGSARITTYAWQFGDGGTGSGANPSHTYVSSGGYTVELTVTDENGRTSHASTQVNPQNVGTNNGGTNPGQGGVNLDIGSAIFPIAIAILTSGLYIVGFLVGGSLVKAGWNLIRPRPETIRIRLKPQNWETGATAEVVPPQPAAYAAPQVPAEAYATPPSQLPPPPAT